jgi:hypothetical protein
MEAIPFAIRGLVLLSWRLLVGGLKPGCQKENWLTFFTYFNSIQKKSALSSFVHLLNAAKVSQPDAGKDGNASMPAGRYLIFVKL